MDKVSAIQEHATYDVKGTKFTDFKQACKYRYELQKSDCYPHKVRRVEGYGCTRLSWEEYSQQLAWDEHFAVGGE